MVPVNVKLNRKTCCILELLLSYPVREYTSIEIKEKTGLDITGLYLCLMRLEDAGWIEHRIDTFTLSHTGTHKRRYYKLTELGQEKAREAILNDGDYMKMCQENTTDTTHSISRFSRIGENDTFQTVALRLTWKQRLKFIVKMLRSGIILFNVQSQQGTETDVRLSKKYEAGDFQATSILEAEKVFIHK